MIVRIRSVNDLMIQYKREIGSYPDDDIMYIEWLEDTIFAYEQQRKRFIPWEFDHLIHKPNGLRSHNKNR